MGGVAASERRFCKKVPLVDDEKLERLCGDVPRRLRKGKIGEVTLSVLVNEVSSPTPRRAQAAFAALSAVLCPDVLRPEQMVEVIRAALRGEDRVARKNAALSARALPAADLLALVPELVKALAVTMVSTLEDEVRSLEEQLKRSTVKRDGHRSMAAATQLRVANLEMRRAELKAQKQELERKLHEAVDLERVTLREHQRLLKRSEELRRLCNEATGAGFRIPATIHGDET